MPADLRDRQAEMLERLESERDFAPCSLAFYGRISTRHARRCFAGTHLMSVDVISNVLLRCTDGAVKDELAAFVLEGTGYLPVDYSDVRRLDQNGDGQVDGRDAVASMSSALRTMADTLDQTIKANADERIDSVEARNIRPHIRESVRLLMVGEQVVMDEGARNQRHKLDEPRLAQ